MDRYIVVQEQEERPPFVVCDLQAAICGEVARCWTRQDAERIAALLNIRITCVCCGAPATHHITLTSVHSVEWFCDACAQQQRRRLEQGAVVLDLSGIVG